MYTYTLCTRYYVMFAHAQTLHQYPDTNDTFEYMYQNNEQISEWSEYSLQP